MELVTKGILALTSKIPKIGAVLNEDNIEFIVHKWLQTSYSQWPIHVGVILGSNYLSFAASILGASATNKGPLQKNVNSVNQIMAYGALPVNMTFSWMTVAKNVMNDLIKPLMNPNIDGIPIHATEFRGARNVDISEGLILVQKAGQQQYMTDNAAPKPMRWAITGYLMTISRLLDAFAVVKPSLLMQLNYLDACATSRRPVLFKDNNNQFYHALVASFEFRWEPKVENGVYVSITLVEFRPYMVRPLQTQLQVKQLATPLGDL